MNTIDNLIGFIEDLTLKLDLISIKTFNANLPLLHINVSEGHWR